MKSRTIAIAGTIVALGATAGPISAAAASSHHKATTQSRLDSSRDARGVRHVDSSPDRSTPDRSSVDRPADRHDL